MPQSASGFSIGMLPNLDQVLAEAAWTRRPPSAVKRAPLPSSLAPHRSHDDVCIHFEVVTIILFFPQGLEVLFTVRSNVTYNGHLDDEGPVFGGCATFRPGDYLQIVQVISDVCLLSPLQVLFFLFYSPFYFSSLPFPPVPKD